ncbi:MAG: molybdopterin-dependent oxidoreductase [Desulfobacteraceae bacterium]|nr:molybdopterin-dependent oxidoreductase [Desulfobacteraceae bacterium]
MPVYGQEGNNLLDIVKKAHIQHPVCLIEDQVFDLVESQLVKIKKTYGTKAILNYTSDGYSGLKNRMQTIFFNCFGGATQWEGSLCWGAGIKAQKYDFGSVKGHYPDDILNAELILVWGKNPKHTSLHLFSLLKKAQKRGAKVIVIDPNKTATAKAFDQYIRIRPATDGALALAMANTIIEKNLHDSDLIKDHVKGFNRFKAHAASFTLQKAQEITGVDSKIIEDLAMAYAQANRASIQVGMGMQRYTNGGNAVRCVDALGAIAGCIGKKGCGVNYAAKSMAPFLYDLEKASEKYAENKRLFTVAELGNFLEKADDPPIKAIFVASGNPLTQSPDLITTKKAFAKVEFKVVFDHFLTDTAQAADLVLPAASVFEQEDIFATSMYSQVLNHSQKAVDPLDEVKPEFEFYLELAKRLGITHMGFTSSDEYLQKSVDTVLKRKEVSYEAFQESYLRFEEDEIAWADKQFRTPSGKIELFSEQALADGLSPLPNYVEAKKKSDQFPLRLLSCHAKESMHSQGFAFKNSLPTAYLHPETAKLFKAKEGAFAFLKDEKNQLKVQIKIDKAVHQNTAFIHQGWWDKSGAVNTLTKPLVSDMGKQAAYYDSFVTLKVI